MFDGNTFSNISVTDALGQPIGPTINGQAA
jgi:hypothetical protein